MEGGRAVRVQAWLRMEVCPAVHTVPCRQHWSTCSVTHGMLLVVALKRGAHTLTMPAKEKKASIARRSHPM